MLRRIKRPGRLGWIAVVLLGAYIGLNVYNSYRLDTGALKAETERLIARAAELGERAMPEYEELVLATLPPNPNNGGFYRFDDNFADAELADVAETQSGGDGTEFEYQLEFDGGARIGLVAAEGRSKLEERDGVLAVSHRDGDYLVNDEPLAIPLANLSDIIIRARADRGNRFQLNWTAEGREADLRDNKLSLDLIADNEFHTYVVNAQNALTRGVDSNQNISTLAITPSNVDGAEVEIDFVRVVSKLWKYQVQKAGTSFETVDDEGRPVLHVIPGHALRYTVEIPEENPQLAFGVAALLETAKPELTVTLSTGDGGSEIFRAAGIDADRWSDQVVDLSDWAGQAVTIEFVVSGGGENVAFISNPIVRSAIRNRFNVIMILEDTLRADHLSTQGHYRETAPARTRFMNEHGIVFLNAHAQATKTRPSIPSLMTSLYPTATGVWNFSDSLSDRYLTLAEIFRAQGFETASFIQNGNAGPYAGMHQGFSSLRDASSIGETTEDIFGRPVLDWLDQNDDRNFFLYLHTVDPHGIYDPPPPYDEWYREAPRETTVGSKPLPKAASIDPPWAETPSGEARRLLYDGEIRHNDTVLDAFLGQLRERGLLEDTLLVFVSDHGEWMGEGGRWEHHPPGQRPVIHVPLMLSYPKGLGAPQRLEESVQLIDAMPTILELASVDTSDMLLQGDSLLGLIEGRDPQFWDARVTVSEEPMIMQRNETPCACGSLFFGPWQLHGSLWNWPRKLKSEFVKSGVYRFRDDGVNPVASYLPDLYTRYLRQQLLSDLISANMQLWRKLTAGEQQNVYEMDPATLEELRGLGYVN